WAIVNPDSSNNKVQHTINGQTFLTCPYNNTIGGNNYTITAKVRVPTALQSNAGILVRYDSSAHNGYALVVTNSVGVSASVLEIKKITNWSDVQMNAVTITGSYLNITTYYTLTLTVSGTNPVQIDGSVTDGVNTKTVSWTDSSSPYTSGKVGLYAYGNAFPIFDDLSVTAQ
ncbi:MAG TPA: hypothetical protein VHY08_02540, partial [Bacillota bacterium]|nr:hypothetical protein [Bacillota bacterium]